MLMTLSCGILAGVSDMCGQTLSLIAEGVLIAFRIWASANDARCCRPRILYRFSELWFHIVCYMLVVWITLPEMYIQSQMGRSRDNPISAYILKGKVHAYHHDTSRDMRHSSTRDMGASWSRWHDLLKRQTPEPRPSPDEGIGLCTKILDFRGSDSSIISMLRGEIPRPIGDFPEILSQRILVGIILVGRLGVDRDVFETHAGLATDVGSVIKQTEQR